MAQTYSINQTEPALILIVDDDIDQLELHRYYLERAGYRVIEASEGREAVGLYQQQLPDLVLLDALMPEQDGIETCAQLRRLEGEAETPILIVTSLDEEVSILEAFEAGATDYLMKPLNWPVLRQRIGRLLQLSQAQRKLRWQSEALQRSEGVLWAATEGSPDAFFTLRCSRNVTGEIEDFIFTRLNSQAENLLGKNREEIIGQPLCELYPANRTGGLFGHYVRVAQTGQIFQTEFEIRTSVLNAHWLSVQAVAIPDSDSIAITTQDITERKLVETQLAESEKRNRIVIESLEEGVILLDQTGNVLTINDSARHLLKLELGSLLEGRMLTELTTIKRTLAHDGKEMVYDEFPTEVSLREGLSISDQIIGLEWPDQEVRWLSVSVRPLFRPNEEKAYSIVVSFSDVTERRQTEQRLNWQALHDALTGLPNRAHFQRRLSQAIEQAAHSKSVFAVAYLDLDGFKAVNDELSHAAGDLLLQEVAQRLRQNVRVHDVVARLGGDEFVLLLPGIQNAEFARQVGETVLKALHQPYDLNGQIVRISASLGLSLYPQTALDADTLLEQADLAMYRAKTNGKNNCQLFKPNHQLIHRLRKTAVA